MKLPYHIAASTAVSGVLYLAFKSWGLAAASFLTGILIDLDHLHDVMREHGKAVNIQDFFRICETAQFNRIVLICHGWEWLVLGTAAAWFAGWNPWAVGALIGLAHHLALDAVHNSSDPRSYFLLWRWKNNFDFDTCFSKMTKYKYGSVSYSPKDIN